MKKRRTNIILMIIGWVLIIGGLIGMLQHTSHWLIFFSISWVGIGMAWINFTLIEYRDLEINGNSWD